MQKVISFLGDSITEGVGTSSFGTKEAAARYDTLCAKVLGMKAYNYGISGTRLAYKSVCSDDPRFDLFMSGRIFDVHPDSDIIVVYGGTNDYGSGDAPLGSFGDTKPNTFFGAVEFIVRSAKKYFPKAKLVFLAPARRAGDERVYCGRKEDKNARVLLEYVDAILKVCEHHGVPAFDCYRNLGIDPNLPEDKEKYAPDGLHFNDEGHRVLAEKLVAFLKNEGLAD
ncbi:MAG: SGNH/GDSL hydrolase family protein [Clostridia bacterium]|nr:SGNH/GDSL hydrolase family protein [Clostridia bacterium]